MIEVRHEERERTVTVQEKVYVVSLTEDEALSLMAVIRHVGGELVRSRRSHIDELGRALNEAGVPAWREFDDQDVSGSVYFKMKDETDE